MSNIVKIMIAAGAVLVIISVLCVGALFVISGGEPVDYLQKVYLRITLASRQAELDQAMFPGDTRPIRFSVRAGDTPHVIARNLMDNGLIADDVLFVDFVRLNDLDRELEAGTYFLKRSQSLTEIAYALTDSRNSQITFRIIEGERIEEIAAKIDGASAYFGFSGADFLAVAGAGAPIDPIFATQFGLPAGASLEGFLFPDTYELPADVSAVMLRDTLTQHFIDKVGTQIPLDAAAQGFSMYQIVTLASIVQREAVRSDEQPMIAGVYRNRLAINMRLEADPTVQYGIGFQNGTWWPRITAADYSNVQSPYNTYLINGLPPGPIANPGLIAIQSAVYPAQSDFYFFRADCRSDGYHDFARTFEEHLANGC